MFRCEPIDSPPCSAKPKLFTARAELLNVETRPLCLLERMTDSLEADWKSGSITKEEYKLCSERLKQLTNIQNKIESLAPFAEKFL
jgi:hypothetical protein